MVQQICEFTRDGNSNGKGIRLKHTFVGAAQTALGEEELKKFPVKQQIQNIAVPKTSKQRYVPISRKDSHGWYICINKDLADAWQMTWGLVRHSKLLLYYSIYINHLPPDNRLP